jgi:SP family sugar:H+ symporter-like MFS transporter
MNRRHLLGMHRGEEARAVIAEFNSVPIDSDMVEAQVAELAEAIKAENEGGKATWAACFSTHNAMWRRTCNGIMLQCIQQLNGQNFYCACSNLADLDRLHAHCF